MHHVNHLKLLILIKDGSYLYLQLYYRGAIPKPAHIIQRHSNSTLQLLISSTLFLSDYGLRTTSHSTKCLKNYWSYLYLQLHYRDAISRLARIIHRHGNSTFQLLISSTYFLPDAGLRTALQFFREDGSYLYLQLYYRDAIPNFNIYTYLSLHYTSKSPIAL